MAIFDRIRRMRHQREHEVERPTTMFTPVDPQLMPTINQRVSVTMGEHVPVPTRVEDIRAGTILLAQPALALEFGDQIVVTWERDDAWFSLDTRVLGVDPNASVPTIQIAAGGRLSRYDERRADVRRTIELPIELRVLRARAVRPARELRTHTVEISANALRFATTAPFAPGDLIEAKIQLGEGTTDVVSARIRIIRVDAVTGSWRSTCTAAFDEILRSDRARILAIADATRAASEPDGWDGHVAPASAPTLDGVGGRDEPHPVGSLDDAVEWLRRR